jgi:hypothetical protein
MSLKAGEIKNFGVGVSQSKTPSKVGVVLQSNKGTANKPTQPILASMFSLEDQIKRMRNNQRTATKNRY